ncbi:MAG: peptidase M14 family protein, partial [Candidatus Methanomethylicota archaeon]
MVNEIPSPREFFGFEIGEDCRLARWDRIVEYFRVLGERSDRVRVEVLGETTEGNPFLLVYITSPENMKNLEKYKEISRKIADPRGLSREEVEKLIREGKVIFAISNSLHATEVGGTQMAVELAYELAVGDDEETRRILNNVILLLFPCFNP